jgi:2',3'-cyclic-nucleotide 2'-phosphodiesterase
MRLLFIGDVVGKPGRTILQDRLQGLRQRLKLDCVVVNGENSAAGFGITETICQDILDAGADAVTLGNHSFDQREALVFIARQSRLIRPCNYPAGTPGRGAALIEIADGRRVLVVNVLGRLFMDALDDPFRAVEKEIDACPLGAACDAILVDVHAEATSEKQAMGYFLDGRVSIVVGTHTHVPTADHRILPAGTAYQSDAGMTGNYQSILGMDRHEPIRRWLEKTPAQRLEVAEGPGMICGLAVETDDRTGLALKVAPLRVGAVLDEMLPPFWE